MELGYPYSFLLLGSVLTAIGAIGLVHEARSRRRIRQRKRDLLQKMVSEIYWAARRSEWRDQK